MAKKKSVGRPGGSINKTNTYPRNEAFHQFRCTEGFNKCVGLLVEDKQYKSKADLIHEAVALLVLRKHVDDPKFDYWKTKIQ